MGMVLLHVAEERVATERLPVLILILLIFKNLSQRGNGVKLGLNHRMS